MKLGEPVASIADRRARGKALRDVLPRSAHAEWQAAPDRPDFVELLRREVVGRPAELLALRWDKMAASPFASFRGAVGAFAFDLAARPVTGIDVQLCGDAHALNLGAYAAPDGHLVFDLNDFDHACRGPYEWDLKRLCASTVLAGREAGQREGACRDAVMALVAAYRASLDHFSQLGVVELARVEVSPSDGRRPLAPIFSRAMRDSPDRSLRKATGAPDAHGRARFRAEPPVQRPLDEAAAAPVLAGLLRYRDTLGAGRQQVLDGYHPHEICARLGGVGSFGVKAWVVLCYGSSPADPLFLQVKQIDACAWAPWLTAPVPAHHGQRACEGQARTQTVTDPFLGWTRIDDADCVVRQWSDHKARIAVEMLDGRALGEYAELCGHVLAKAHARTGDAAALAGYVGTGDNLDVALARFAATYADRAEADHARLIAARRAGSL